MAAPTVDVTYFHSETSIGSASTTLSGSDWQVGDICVATVAGLTSGSGSRSFTVSLPAIEPIEDHAVNLSGSFRVAGILSGKQLTASDIGSTVSATASAPFYVGTGTSEWALMLTRFRGTGAALGAAATGGADATSTGGAVSVYGPAITARVGSVAASFFIGAFSSTAPILRAGNENGWTVAGGAAGTGGGLNINIGVATIDMAASGTTAPMPGWARSGTQNGFAAFTIAVGPPSPWGYNLSFGQRSGL